jgi:hypothetical protein
MFYREQARGTLLALPAGGNFSAQRNRTVLGVKNPDVINFREIVIFCRQPENRDCWDSASVQIFG